MFSLFLCLTGWKFWVKFPTNYTCNVDDSKSTTGYIFTLSNGSICWRSTLLIVIFTIELEYIATGEAAKEAWWLKGTSHRA